MKSLLAALLLLSSISLSAQTGVAPGPDRRPGEGEGPFKRLIIRGATVIDGTGAPPQGPMDIVIEGNGIKELRSVGYPKVPINAEGRPKDASRAGCMGGRVLNYPELFT